MPSLSFFKNAFFSLRSQLKLHLYRVASLPYSLFPFPRPPPLQRMRRRLTDFVFCIGYYKKILDAQRINILHLRSTNAECYFYVNDPDEQSTDSPSGASTWGENVIYKNNTRCWTQNVLPWHLEAARERRGLEGRQSKSSRTEFI